MIIETVGLQKSFTRRAGRSSVSVDAVTGIDLGVKETEIYGFLGPNGAGKTTTMRMLTTLVTPDAGEGTVVGHDLRREPGAVRREIGYVQQTGGLWDASTPREELVLQGRFHGAGAAAARRRADEVIEQLGIAEFAGRRCGTLSGGQRRRVEIGLGVVHSPTLLFLDEPSTGLDPQSRAALWDTIRSLRDGGVTVFLTTHYLEEADALCDRVSIVDHGAVVATGSPTELKREVSGEVVSVTASVGGDALAMVSAGLARQEWVARAEVEGATVRLVVVRGDVALPAVVQAFGAAGIAIAAIDLHRASLDDVFLDKTGRQLHQV